MALALLKHFCAAAVAASAAAASTASAAALPLLLPLLLLLPRLLYVVHVFNPHQPKYVMTGGDGCVPEGTNCMTS